ncbi:cation transporter [Acinetobacter sp. ANC 4633]|uniref:cation efflux protein, CzcI-like n=1 Tax=Acinetobacter sp. ANC 4633 TaxID=2529845 RepID=UPI0010397D0D|nr:cation efflux protein, CzcI-like [Acinetobacter sp. ANC 4633]TCB25279.1 cation transporter [Acinetobacter sp. ANC 4633]
MKRCSVFITILLTLFMFQSVWNVAAAFCTHENQPAIQKSSSAHFGHHQLSSEHVAQHSNVANTVGDPPDVQDHSDHLPSFSPGVVFVQVQTLTPQYASMQVLRHYDWNNLYQSPDVFLPNPPPVFAPLLVG